MEHENDEINRLLENKPENFEDVKEWANFQLAIRLATKQESFLKEMAGLATTIAAIIGVLTAAFTSYQLWDKITNDKKDQNAKYKFEALKLYTDHWDDFNEPKNCGNFLFFAEAVKKDYIELNQIIVSENGRKCTQKLGDSEKTANFDETKPAQQDTSYNARERITPDKQSDETSPTKLSDFTFYIQYKIGDKPAENTADEIKSFLAKKIGATAYGTEAVANVPKTDEIRMYKGTQRLQADELKSELKKETGREFTITNLQASYPKLPANLMEIWLKE